MGTGSHQIGKPLEGFKQEGDLWFVILKKFTAWGTDCRRQERQSENSGDCHSSPKLTSIVAWIRDLEVGMSGWPGGTFWRTFWWTGCGELRDKILERDGRCLVATLYSPFCYNSCLKMQIWCHIYSNIYVFLNHLIHVTLCYLKEEMVRK